MIGEQRPIAVRAKSLTRAFGDFVAVDSISFEIRAGEIWGFLGPNGAGKSTTIRMLCGVLAPTSGLAEVLGYDVASDPEAVKLRIGYMSQGSALWNDLTVEEHLHLYAGMFELYGSAQRDAVEEWMERVGLSQRRHTLVAELPGGFRKRLALACALLHRPKVLFLDEPTAGVDPVSRRDFWAILYQLVTDGLTVFVATAYLDEAERANRVGLMNRGRMIRCDAPRVLRNDLDHAYYKIHSADPRKTREALQSQRGVLSVLPAGEELRLILDERAASAEELTSITPFTWQRIMPSLEDVFIALVRHEEEIAHAA